MPKKDPQQVPATKQDIALLMRELGKMYDALERWNREFCEELSGQICSMEQRLRDEIRRAGTSVHSAIEQLRGDLPVQ